MKIVVSFLSSDVFSMCKRSVRVVFLAAPLLLLACGGGEEDPVNPDDPGGPEDPIDTPGPVIPKVVINEAAATNREFEDEDGDNPDWFELYNTGEEPVSLNGWFISDNPDKPEKWVFPDLVLEGGQVLLIWASNKERNTVGEPLHTGFALSSKGETMVLHNNQGELIDTLHVADTPAGVSIGRSARDGSVVYFDQPTPGTDNSPEEFAGVVTGLVDFSHQGGVQTVDQVVLSSTESGVTNTEIANTENAEDGFEIRYTLDATIPREDSPLYASPIPIDGTTVIRARVFKQNYIPSSTESRTYLHDRSHELPVVTLVTDPLNLFDVETGIYVFGLDYEEEPPYHGANFREDWEREVHFSFFEESGELGTAFNAGIKIFGGWTRNFDQKSLALFARGSYGTSEFEYPFFAKREFVTFQSLVLRNSGNDWMHTMLRDAAITSLMEDADIETQAFRPVATYINGEYWGLYNIREKVSEHFLASHKNVKANEVDMLEGNAWVREGSNSEYLEMLQFMEENSLGVQSNYDVIADQIDIENYILYQVTQIFIGNYDWPRNNLKYWKSPNTKWRWILFDTDRGFALFDHNEPYTRNTLAHALAEDGGGTDSPNNPPWSTFLLRSLLENEGFKTQFINRFADEMNSRFKPEHVQAHIDSLSAVIASEIPAQWERWSGTSSWAAEVDKMKNFAVLRPPVVADHIVTQFGLSGTHTLSIENDNPVMGHVQLNSLEIKDSSWEGLYFAGIPVQLTAVAATGYQFAGWTGSVESNDASIEVDMNQAVVLRPLFTVVE